MSAARLNALNLKYRELERERNELRDLVERLEAEAAETKRTYEFEFQKINRIDQQGLWLTAWGQDEVETEVLVKGLDFMKIAQHMTEQH